MIWVSRSVAVFALLLTFAACAYVASVDQILKTVLSSGDRILLLSGFLVGAASSALSLISLRKGGRQLVRAPTRRRDRVFESSWTKSLNGAVLRTERKARAADTSAV
jgi:hypothetical protein